MVRPKILIIESDESARELVRGVVKDFDVELLEARTGEDGLCMLEEPLACIILAVNLPGMLGFETLTKIRAHPGNLLTPVVITTIRDLDQDLILESHELGLVDYLRKPLSKVLLRNKLCFFTERFRLESELRATQTRLESELEKQTAKYLQAQKMEAFGQLAGGVAHDYNNLLVVIRGYLDMLRHELDAGGEFFERVPSDVQTSIIHFLKPVMRAIERAARLTQQLMLFGRKKEAVIEIVDMKQLVDENLKMLTRMIGEDISIVKEFGDGVFTVSVDSGHVSQAFMNIVLNARDAMPIGGILTVKLRCTKIKDQPVVQLVVSDTGVGMTPEVQARVFEPFFTTKGVGLGTGLGLAVVQSVVEQLGGSIFLESEVGKGTSFTLSFPWMASDDKANALSKAPVQGILPAYGTILLVEDDAPVRTLTENILRRAGYNVLSAATPGDALLMAEQSLKPIDLLLTDVVMPMMTGPALASRILKGNFAGCGTLRVLFVSGYTAGILGISELNVEDSKILWKPYSRVALLSRIAAILA